MKTIGLTGGIACGKSAVSQILIKKGIPVVSSDELAHQAIEPGELGYSEVLQAFGTGILGNDRYIDRKKLGTLVFSNDDARKRLESIIHPVVIAKIKDIIRNETQQGRELLVVEVPLLFEVGLTELFDQIWVVSATPELQIKRLTERDHLPVENANLRIKSQLPLSFKETQADFVIYNNGSILDLEDQISCLLQNGVN